MRKLMILLSLILIVFISGCGEQVIQTGKVNDGVVIKRFSFDSSRIYERDSIGLNLELQNIGEVEATLESIRIYGGWNVDQTDLTNKKLSPSIPEVNFEGESRSVRRILNAPDVTAETTYSFSTRVVYKYETKYTGTLRVATNTYLETLPEDERNSLFESSGVVSSSLTGGPLSVIPMKGRNFIVSGDEETNPSIVFELSNVGSGYPSNSSTINQDTMYYVKIKSVYGLKNMDCDSYGSKSVRLSQGKNRLFNCSFEMTTPIVNKEDIIFTITFDYYYYVDGTTSITVSPLPGD